MDAADNRNVVDNDVVEDLENRCLVEALPMERMTCWGFHSWWAMEHCLGIDILRILIARV